MTFLTLIRPTGGVTAGVPVFHLDLTVVMFGTLGGNDWYNACHVEVVALFNG